MESKFKKGDVIKCIKIPSITAYSTVGDIDNEFKPLLYENYEVVKCSSYGLWLNINKQEYSHPIEIFELVETDKLDLAVKKLKEDLLNKELTIKTSNEQRIILRAICQELEIPHYGISLEVNVDIDKSYNTLYSSYTEFSNQDDSLWYSSIIESNKVLINFEDLIAEFNQFKK